MSGAHGVHADVSNKRVAILIAVIAALLAIAEAGGKSAQTEALSYNITASNTWAFFQAKTIRQTTMRTAAEHAAIAPVLGSPAAEIESRSRQIERWRATAQRYETEPETGEGRRELMAKARELEAKRDKALAAYHQFEYAAAILQIAIVLASAAIITGVGWLVGVAIGASGLGVVFAALGWLAPTLLHL